jgi:polysaccharide biosynthesis/export protein
LNHSVLLHSEKQQIVTVKAFALIFLLLGVPLLLGAQTGILDTTQQNSQNPLNQQNQQPGSRTPFPVLPERPKVNITNTPGTPEQPAINPMQGVILPPEPDIEFQQFVAASLGYGLPIFGQNLFEGVPSTFAPLDYVPVTPDYLIGPGDELLIRGWGQIDITNYRAVVDRNGSIYVPTVGTISVAGLRYDRLNDYLKSAIGRFYKNFDLDVTLGRLRSIQVFVVGQVKRPGSYTVSSLSTLVNTLFASGGPSKRGSMRQIQLKRVGQIVSTFDFYDLLTKGDKSKDARLMPGDVIYVPPVGRLVALAGSVNVPAVFELKDHDSLGDVIQYAGGLTTTAAGQQALIERIDARQVRQADEFPLTADGMKRELQDGDIVRFLHISPRFENAVTLRGNVAVPGRYPWREGMRVKDLIPNRESLVTEEYWKRQNLLGLNPASNTFQLEEQMDQQQQQQQQQQLPAIQPQYQLPNQTVPQGINPNLTAPNAPASVLLNPIINPIPPTTTEGAQIYAQGAQPGVLGDRTLAERVGRTQATRIKQEELKNQIKRSTAEINWEYAVIQRLNPNDLTSQLLPFNLGKAIDGDATQNLPLQSGDVVTIFSQADMQVPIAQQSKFVRLEGEFHSAGIYQVEPGETMRHLLTRVGGVTSQAYLFGSEFTRESVREDQQRRLEEYVTSLQQTVESTPVASPEDQARLATQRQLVDRMRNLRSTGRIVLEVKPAANSISDYPDMVLEDGDRMFIPFRPATVNVLGAVYNSNSFIYKPGKTVADYLRLSGGVTREGDRHRAFVIRANGATVSSQQHTSLLVNNFNTLRLMPGDTIVVPARLNRGAVLRGLRDWSQVFQQFALGAAGISVLLP